jgi:hypothetical protein
LTFFVKRPEETFYLKPLYLAEIDRRTFSIELDWSEVAPFVSFYRDKFEVFLHEDNSCLQTMHEFSKVSDRIPCPVVLPKKGKFFFTNAYRVRASILHWKFFTCLFDNFKHSLCWVLYCEGRILSNTIAFALYGALKFLPLAFN